MDCHAAVMVSFSPAASRKQLRQRLTAIHPALGDFEEEEIIPYSTVAARSAKRGLSYIGCYLPGGLPVDQI